MGLAMEMGGSSAPEHRVGGGKGENNGDEGVERRLAHFAFVREDRDREVRLLFRDVPPSEIAAAFKATGATLISIAGERILPAVGKEAGPQPPTDTIQPGNETQQARAADKNSVGTAQTGKQPGNITIRYFFDMGEVVYTVIIDVPSGVVGSVAGVYPSARLAEDEIHKRLGAMFSA